MTPRSSRGIIIGFLVLAVVVSAYILAVDTILWEDNPINYHAYALIGFVVVDLVLILVVLAKPSVGSTLALVWGVFMVLAIIGDAATSLGLGSFGFTPKIAAEYLFLGIAEFDGQTIINPAGLSVDVLLGLYVLLAISGAIGRKAIKKQAT